MTFRKFFIFITIIMNFNFFITTPLNAQYKAKGPLYLDSNQPIKVRVEDLLTRMTLEEKVGQMNMPIIHRHGKDIPGRLDVCRQLTRRGTGKYDGLGPMGGFFALAWILLHEGPRQQAEFFNELQQIAVEETRLKIPLLQTEEGTHGLMCASGTIFPEGLGLGSTWNMDLIKKIYAAVAREARSAGIHQLNTLCIEPYRDPRLGRNQEGYTEDQYLGSHIAKSIVESVQGDDISARDKAVASLTCYPGQSEGVGGMNLGAMEVSERKLRKVFLPPWIAGIKEAGALGVMATYPAIDDMPAHASSKLLTKILREELGFEGLVLCEGGGIGTVINEGIAEDMKEAGKLNIEAGVDVGISSESGYMNLLIENVKEGKVSMELIDRAVRRILRQKYRLGLFENPYVDPDYAVNVRHSKEHQDIALDAAREGIVLLKNDNETLPLYRDKIKSIAVIGPNADHETNQLGDYRALKISHDIVTILEGIKEKVLPQTKVSYVQGCEVIGDEVNEISQAAEAAKSSDVAVVVLGENERQLPKNKATCGEGYDVASLDLTGHQEELLKAVYKTGTPTILVLINGRPLSIRWAANNILAILDAWLPGEKGGAAVADVLFGDYNPAGKLPVTFPRHVGQLPVYYNHNKSRANYFKRYISLNWKRAYLDLSSPLPLYVFGHGLSYTEFEYSNLQISPRESGLQNYVYISADIKNIGAREGGEVVQLYINDVISSMVTPIKELKGFKKIFLKPGKKETVKFRLTPKHISLLNMNLEPVVEPGKFEVMVGSSSEDIRLTGSFEKF